MNWRNDPRTCWQSQRLSHMCTWKTSGVFNGIQTHDLCCWCSAPTNWAMKPLRCGEVTLLGSFVTCSHLSGFIVQLERGLHRHRRGRRYQSFWKQLKFLTCTWFYGTIINNNYFYIYPGSFTHPKVVSGRSCIRSNWNKLGVNFEEGRDRRKPSKSTESQSTCHVCSRGGLGGKSHTWKYFPDLVCSAISLNNNIQAAIFAFWLIKNMSQISGISPVPR
mgnify:CR=1 FL=1